MPLVSVDRAAAGRCKLQGGLGFAALGLLRLQGRLPLILGVDLAGQGQRLDALAALGLEQAHFGIAAVLALVLGLAILVAGCAVRVDGSR